MNTQSEPKREILIQDYERTPKKKATVAPVIDKKYQSAKKELELAQ
jgi:hypothetical protein